MVDEIECGDVVREPYNDALTVVRDITVETWDTSSQTYLDLELLESVPNGGVGEIMVVGTEAVTFVAKAGGNR